MTGQRRGGEEGGVEGWMWINVAGRGPVIASPEPQRSARTAGSSVTPSLFCTGGLKEGEKETPREGGKEGGRRGEEAVKERREGDTEG